MTATAPSPQSAPLSPANVHATVLKIVDAQPVSDLHTHCYTPAFGASPDPAGLLLWGIDELVVYHYLVAEVYRIVPATELPYEKFWAMTKPQQADHIWKHLFVDRTPVSEACRGVVTTLHRLGLDPNEKSLAGYRKWFAQWKPTDYIDKVMQVANVDSITMTNPVFDDHERAKWDANPAIADDPRFQAVLRIDPLLRDWPTAAGKLRAWGYDVSPDFAGPTVREAQRFLTDWIGRMKAIYVAMSLPPEFQYPNPANPAADRVIRDIMMPVLADLGLPWAMMIGSRLQVNPALKDAGDMVGKADVQAVVRLCNEFPNNKFLVTMLARENQHELCVATRKFGNLMIFGCWWFLNNPSIIEEMTRMRMELLGTSFIPQHSDARILDQLVYKWHHSRAIIAKVLADKYLDLMNAGFVITADHAAADAALLLRDNFRSFIAR